MARKKAKVEKARDVIRRLYAKEIAGKVEKAVEQLRITMTRDETART